MYAIAIVRYRRPITEVEAATPDHRVYLRQLKADGRLVAAGPMDPRYGGIFLLKVSDDNPQRDLDAIRDGDPFYQQHIAQYQLMCWNVVIGRDDLDRIPVAAGTVAGSRSPVGAGSSMPGMPSRREVLTAAAAVCLPGIAFGRARKPARRSTS